MEQDMGLYRITKLPLRMKPEHENRFVTDKVNGDIKAKCLFITKKVINNPLFVVGTKPIIAVFEFSFE